MNVAGDLLDLGADCLELVDGVAASLWQRIHNLFEVYRHQRKPLVEVIVKLSGDAATLFFMRADKRSTQFQQPRLDRFLLADVPDHRTDPCYLTCDRYR